MPNLITRRLDEIIQDIDEHNQEEGTMPDEQGYNGWTNYETWCVNLWLTNDQELYHYAMMFDSADSLRQAIIDDVYNLIDDQSTIDTNIAMMFQNLLIASLQSVNWYEIYDSLHGEDESD